MKTRRFLLLFLLSLLIGGTVLPANAEEGGMTAILRSVQADEFPLIRVSFDVYDAQGKFASAMAAENLTFIEDGVAHPADSLQEESLPLRLIVAINPGAPMAVRDKSGVSRYEKVADALQTWASALPPENADEMSLIVTAGPLVSNQPKDEWLKSLAGYHPDFQTAIPSLQSLAIALDIASAPPTQEGEKCAVLFITPHLPDQNALNEVEAQAARAAQNGIRVNVWLIDSETYFFHNSANALKTLALQTGGNYFAFSENENFPDLETYFSPLRHIYRAAYTSSIAASGDHTLALQLQFNGANLVSEPATFALEVAPPNPILLSPPLQVLRQPSPEHPYDADALTPASQEIEMMVEFPDGHPRGLVRTALYVDGEKVAENTAPPFEKFIWDIQGYDASGEHSLQVEAEDVLGLKKTSLGVPVTVTVVQPPKGLRGFLARNSKTITLSAILAAGLLLAGILFFGSKPVLKTLRQRRQERKRYKDPATQPVPRSLKTRKKPSTRKKDEVPARLEPLQRDGTPRKGSPILLSESELSFGTDPVRAAHILDDPSISPLHAKIQRREDGRYLLLDAGSLAGTWVNFEPVSAEGHLLVHGDRIDFGQKCYRFVEANPAPPPKPILRQEGSAE